MFNFKTTPIYMVLGKAKPRYIRTSGGTGTGSTIYIGPLVKFLKFLSPFQKNFETNYTSIERTNKQFLDL